MKTITPEDNWPESWKYSFPYDQHEIYDEITNHGYAYAYSNRRNSTIEMVQEVIPAGGRILDMAGAQGNFSLTLAELGYNVTWNDLREELIDYIKLKHEHGTINFAPGNAFELEFEQPFDCVVATEIIEHVAHPDDFLRKLANLVRPGGYVVLTTPNGAYFRNKLPRFSDCENPEVFEEKQFQPNSDGHIFLMWPDELDSLAERAGLRIDKLGLFTTPLTNGHMKTSTLLKVLPRKVVMGIESVVRRLPSVLKNRVMVHAGARYQRPEAGTEPVASADEQPTRHTNAA
jgi:2-polyprenyl-3-methyl-5-hydroxy-6-metoxy-1,4-benzoquinol methylase